MGFLPMETLEGGGGGGGAMSCFSPLLSLAKFEASARFDKVGEAEKYWSAFD
jgi:hypothetical protein